MGNRKYTRLQLDVVTELQLADGTRYYGETADLSLDGAFIRFNPPANLQTDQPCSLELIIKSEEGWVRTELKGIIAHIRDDGVGVRFDVAGTKGHEALLKLLIEGNADIDQLLEELSNNPRNEFRFQGE